MYIEAWSEITLSQNAFLKRRHMFIHADLSVSTVLESG